MNALLQLVEPEELTPFANDGIAIGIDLGTTNSLVGVPGLGLVRDETGSALTPSVVSYNDAKVFVGNTVENGNLKTIRSIKRLMGKRGDEIENTSFEIVENNPLRVQIGGQKLTPVEISATILKHLMQKVENTTGMVAKNAVITVPAYFDDAARTATRDAARLAGLQVLRLLNEPTAAALAYGLDKEAEGIYAIYDLGGGTFDISLLKLYKGVFQVLSTGGHTSLGGDDFDVMLMQNVDSILELIEARSIKEQLSKTESYGSITRANFNEWINPLIDATLNICKQALQDAGLTAADINGVVLVGGSTRIPHVVSRVGEFFGQTPRSDIDPDYAVALGATAQAKALTEGSNNLLLDVTPLSLGIETMGKIVEKIIPRNSPIPISKTQEFTTHVDGQAAMSIHVVQGERDTVTGCRSLARFELLGIPPMPAGKPRIEVMFTVDADGILTVTAKEKTTGVLQEVEIKPSYGLTEEEISNMLNASHQQGAKDLEFRLLAELKLKAERLHDTTAKALISDGHLLSQLEREKINSSLHKLRLSIDSQDRSAITSACNALVDVTNEFAELRVKQYKNSKDSQCAAIH